MGVGRGDRIVAQPFARAIEDDDRQQCEEAELDGDADRRDPGDDAGDDRRRAEPDQEATRRDDIGRGEPQAESQPRPGEHTSALQQLMRIRYAVFSLQYNTLQTSPDTQIEHLLHTEL